MTDIPEVLKSGEIARLIPVIADSRREQRVASVFLATLAAVPDFAAASSMESNIYCLCSALAKILSVSAVQQQTARVYIVLCDLG